MIKINKYEANESFATAVGSVVKWFEHRDYNRHGLGSKLTRAILLYPLEKHFTALFLLGGLGEQF